MTIQGLATEVSAGLGGKSDCVATWVAREEGFQVIVDSTVKILFGRHIEEAARRACARFKVRSGRLKIKDDGALDYVVEARVEAALRAAGFEAPETTRVLSAPLAPDKERERRSRLYIPGNQPDLVQNVGLFGADCVVLDLEDSVAPARKAEARILVRRTLESVRAFFGFSEIIVRINPLSGSYGASDLKEVVGALPQAIILPKCEGASDVIDLEKELARLEAESGIAVGSILIMPLIETAKGVIHASEIAAASARNAALCFGAEDFARDLGVSRTRAGTESLAARQNLVLAAKAAGIQAHDSVFSDVDDEIGLATSCSEARGLGFSGKGLIHPRQIEAAHRAFDAQPEEVEEAKRIVEALDRAEVDGKGVASLEGRMIDAPVAERARKLIARDARHERPARGEA